MRIRVFNIVTVVVTQVFLATFAHSAVVIAPSVPPTEQNAIAKSLTPILGALSTPKGLCAKDQRVCHNYVILIQAFYAVIPDHLKDARNTNLQHIAANIIRLSGNQVAETFLDQFVRSDGTFGNTPNMNRLERDETGTLARAVIAITQLAMFSDTEGLAAGNFAVEYGKLRKKVYAKEPHATARLNTFVEILESIAAQAYNHFASSGGVMAAGGLAHAKIHDMILKAETPRSREYYRWMYSEYLAQPFGQSVLPDTETIGETPTAEICIQNLKTKK